MRNFILSFSALILLFSVARGQQQPQADFSWSPNPACAGQAVQFSDQSTGFIAPTFQYYDFGDGNNSFNNPNPVHTYANPGTYSVYYCVTDSVTFDSSCVSKSVVVVMGPCTTPDTVSGLVYHDVNSNGSFDATDYPLAGMRVDIGGFQFATNAQGMYSAAINAGTYTVSIPQPGNYSVSTPATGSHSLTLSGNGTSYGADFGMTVSNPTQDLQVMLVTSRFRPGFQARVWLYYRNNGTSPMTGTVVLTYDDSLTYTQSTPTATHNPGTRQLGYSFSNLLPQQTGGGRLEFTLPATVPLGTPITNSAVVNPVMGDDDTTNNYVTHVDTVRGSYDPNDKQVAPAWGEQGFVVPGERLTYTIRFQNTGTDTAFTVVVVDTLPANLDPATLDMEAASHAYSLSFDQPQGILTWTFDNILLPDSNTNEPASHGFIQFSINPTAGLADFTTIENRAAIYFDFNAPIITNYTLTTINSATGIAGEELFPGLQIFPQPATEQVWVSFENPLQARHELRLLDLQGRTLLRKETRDERLQVDLSLLPSGLYIFRLEAGDGRTAAGKLLKK